MKKKILFIFIAGLLVSCSEEMRENTTTEKVLFSLLKPEETGITFSNYVEDAPDRGLQFYDYFYNGSGVATGDINNDGLVDIFFCGNDTSNKLYLNKGDFKFEDISLTSGIKSNRWSTGVTMVDINDDGFLDIYVSNSGPYIDDNSLANELYINNGDNTFTEQAERYGINDGSRSTQASFFDMDNDGDLDLWVLNHGLRNRGGSANEWLNITENLDKKEYARESNTLYRNDGNGVFTDISKEAGILKIGFGLGLSIFDIDEDGYLDVYVANDFFIPDFMFINNGDGTFTDKISRKMTHNPYYAMGCDAADINNDGLNDMVIVDMTPSDHVRNKVLMASMDVKGFDYLTKYKNFNPQYMFNSLYINNGAGIMSDIALFAGVSQTDWSWAPLLADFDNDGYKDLMITNGFRKDTKNNDWRIELDSIRNAKGASYTPADYFEHLKNAEVNPVPNQIFKNLDGLSFENKVENWGFETPSSSNGAAYADFDNDGDLDIVINNFDIPAFIYKNNTVENTKSNFIRIKLESGNNYNSVLHSKVCIYYGEKMQCNDFSFTRGYESYVEPIVHFGISNIDKIDRVEIKWNDGKISSLFNPKINKVHIINKNKVNFETSKKEKKRTPFVSITSSNILQEFVHQENYFDDFQKEILLPHRQSMLGPAIAVGDVNSDGLDDFYVGGAKNQMGYIYLQNDKAKFVLQDTNDFIDDTGSEDVGAHFFDADNDGDLDLYVASGGGGEFVNQLELLQDRLYINDGLGRFKKSQSSLPKMLSSTKAITASDIDNDGDQDLFIGGRTLPGKYPLAPESYILINENGKFKNMTSQFSEELSKIGMVTDAIWIDMNVDGKKDLVLVGEWMPITVFITEDNKLVNKTNEYNFDGYSGWWNSIHSADIDGDGDVDLIAGNTGLNNKFHPSKKKPLFVYANDFDENGTQDIVLSKIYNGKKVPLRGKECSTSQMPFISEKFPTYSEFANASLETVYEEEKLNNSTKYEVYDFTSYVFLNDGNGKYNAKPLPKEAQLFPVNGIISNDFDKDGILDLILAGNNFQTEVETPMYDAGKGLYLKGEGNGDFSTNIKLEYSGLFMHEDVKNIKIIGLGIEKRPGILVANNNSFLELYVYRN